MKKNEQKSFISKKENVSNWTHNIIVGGLVSSKGEVK